MNKIELSESVVNALTEKGRMAEWARSVISASRDKNIILSPEDVEISNNLNEYIKKVDKFGSKVAGEEISAIINKIVTDEVYNAPTEILDQIFDTGSYDEFDKVKVTKSLKNTLIAYENQARTGNVDKSYLDFKEGTVQEKHLQIEAEIKLSDLRRQGALGVAEYAMKAVEEFNNRKFAIVMSMIDKAITGGANAFTCASALTLTALNDFTGWLLDNIAEGTPEAIGLTSTMRGIYQIANINDTMSDTMLNDLNRMSLLQFHNGVALVPVKAGKKMGDGKTLVEKDKIIGIAGKAGFMYTKGDLRTLSDVDINREVLHIKYTGVEFGVCFTDIDKIATLTITK